jgi:hypothetical protein
MENIEWLNNWYTSNCNGDWEHTYGIRIVTLDNPGWSFKADIIDTVHEGKTLAIKELGKDDDWYTAHCDGDLFEAFGDTTKLGLLITLFKDFIETP